MTDSAHSPSPDKRLGKLLKHTSSRISNADSSSSLVPFTEPSNDQGGLRKSIDRSINNLKDKARRETEVTGRRRNSGDSKKKLSRLIPKRSRKTLRDGDDDSASEHSFGGEGSSTLRPGSQQGSKLNFPNNVSVESLGKSAASSLLTDDSDHERYVESSLYISACRRASILSLASCSTLGLQSCGVKRVEKEKAHHSCTSTNRFACKAQSHYLSSKTFNCPHN